MTDYSLIQKLETVRQGLPDVKYISGFMIAMDIVRQHSAPRPTSIAHAEMQDEQRGQALNRTVGRVQNGGEREHHEQPQDMVKRVAEAISDAMIWNGTVMCTSPEDLAKSAIAAMGASVNGATPDALLQQAWELSTWAGSINWRGGENQKEWLDDLRTLIEAFQTNYEAYKTNAPKREIPVIGRDIEALAYSYAAERTAQEMGITGGGAFGEGVVKVTSVDRERAMRGSKRESGKQDD